MKSIFVSSTFKDMQVERNLIQFQIMPEINRFLREYEETIDFTDLRWGIDTTKYINSTPEKQLEGEEKVLKICLEEISKTPYFIVILGERYGWIPKNKDMVKHVIDVINKEKQTSYVLENDNISVTHLEIDYGAFFRKHPENCLFYFREIRKKEEDKKKGFLKHRKKKRQSVYFSEEEELEKINLLKEEIKKEFPGRVKSYSVDLDEQTNEIKGLENFTNMVIQDVKEIIQRDFKKYETKYWQEKEEKEINYIIKQKTAKFTGQEAILKKIDEFIENDTDKDVLFITGKAGTGKSALSSKICELYKEKYNVVPFFMDNTEHSRNPKDILLYHNYQLNKIIFSQYSACNQYLDSAHMLFEYIYNDQTQIIENVFQVSEDTDISDISIKTLQEILKKNLDIYEKLSEKKIIFVIDAINQMQEIDNENKYNWLNIGQNTNVKYIVTCIEDSEFTKNVLSRMEHINLKELDRETVIEVLKYNNKYSTKELNDEVIQKICEKQEATNFLYLSLVLQRLNMFCKYDYDKIRQLGNDMNAINKHMLNIIDYLPEKLNYLCVQVMEYANKIYPTSMFKDILALISNTRYGLREKDIEGIFKQNNLEFDTGTFKTLLNFLNSYFIIRDDERIDFSHGIIKQTIKAEYENEHFANTNSSYNDIITAYLVDEIFFNETEKIDMMYVNELVFHLWKSKKYIIILTILIEGIMGEEVNTNILSLARELWKYFRVSPHWLFEIQEYIASNTPVEIVTIGKHELNIDKYCASGDCVDFFFTYLRHVMDNNEYEKRIFLDLVKWWENRVQEGNINENINVDAVFKTSLKFISEYSKNKIDIVEALEKLIQQDEKNYIYYIDLIEALKEGRECYWLNKCTEYIEIALKNENVKKDSNLYEEILLNKAEVSYFTENKDVYNEIITQLLEKYNLKISNSDATFNDFKRYLEIIKDMHTKFNTEPLKENDTRVREIIKVSLDILKWAKNEYRKRPNGEMKFQLAKAYELVVKQYNILVYKEEYNELLPYNTDKSGKYLQCFIEILKGQKQYYDYLVEVIDYQIELLEKEELRVIVNENNLNKDYINGKLRKATETLLFDDVIQYFKSLPEIKPIYEVEEYENVDELLEIYIDADNFTKEYYDESLYSINEITKIISYKNNIEEAKFCLLMAKEGITEKYIKGAIGWSSSQSYSLDTFNDKAFKYRAYQYLKANTLEERKRIIEEMETTYNNNSKFFEINGGQNEIENRVALYKAKKDAYINIIQNDVLETENEEQIIKEIILEKIFETQNTLINDTYKKYIQKYKNFASENYIKCFPKVLEEIIQFQKENKQLENITEYEDKLAKLYKDVAKLYKNEKEYEKAEENYLLAIRLKEKLAKIEKRKHEEELAILYNGIAVLYDYINRYNEAEKYYLETLKLEEEFVKEDSMKYNPSLAIIYSNMALFYNNIKNYEEAEKYYLFSIKIKEKLAEENPEKYIEGLANSYYGAVDVLKMMQKYKEAEQYAKKIIHIFEVLGINELQKYSITIDEIYNTLLEIYREQEDEAKIKEIKEKIENLNS